MNILITGCNGQLGNELQLLEKNHPEHLFFNTDVQQLDITNKQAIDRFVDENAIEGIINCAAFTAVDKAESAAELCELLNAKAPEHLAEAIERRQGWIIQISTDYVFDGTSHLPYTEEMPTCPVSIYGKTKLEGEQNVMRKCRKAVVIRTAWLYSTYGNNFVKTMIRLGKEKPSLGVVADQIGTPTNASDLALAIFSIISQGILPGIYHYSDEGVCSWYDFAVAIHRAAGIENCRINPLHTSEYPTPAHRPHYSVLDKSKIKKAYNLDIPHWERSLECCIKKLINDKNA
ncbi:MAG: dTDP-4-dehydrorhamnose reductase [Prevotella sp.]|nr:dTDP-4-dehydrorhamnose reductase [Prevotella sp.]